MDKFLSTLSSVVYLFPKVKCRVYHNAHYSSLHNSDCSTVYTVSVQGSVLPQGVHCTTPGWSKLKRSPGLNLVSTRHQTQDTSHRTPDTEQLHLGAWWNETGIMGD